MSGVVLVVNSGSSSVKLSAFEATTGADPALVFRGTVDRIGSAPVMTFTTPAGPPVTEALPGDGAGADHAAVLRHLVGWTEAHVGGRRPVVVGHRVVHGGTDFDRPVVVDAAVLDALDRLARLAPLHQPHNLAAIRAVAALDPALPQVACFDTAFHHAAPTVAQRFALPRELHDGGIRRYGFHGLSYEYVAGRLRERAPSLAGGRIVVAHLGSGASLCAMRDGRSVETTMGFTALDGLPMGTRCGALDPGVVLHLLTAGGLSPAEVEDLLYRRSGLLGVSALSADMRVLLASRDPRAVEAVELFVYRIARETGALAAALGGFDGLVFTGGIGAHAPEIRRAVCERCRWLGVALDEAANAGATGGADRLISTPSSAVAVWTIPTNEELTIARHSVATVAARTAPLAAPALETHR